MRTQFLILSVLLTIVSSCNNKYKKDFYVFKSTLNNDSIIFFVDEKEIGQIPYIDTIQSTNLTDHAKLVSLGKGKHEISAKDKYGNYLSSVLIEITGKDLNTGSVSKSNFKITTSVVNNTNKYSFKNRSINEFFIFSFE